MFKKNKWTGLRRYYRADRRSETYQADLAYQEEFDLLLRPVAFGYPDDCNAAVYLVDRSNHSFSLIWRSSRKFESEPLARLAAHSQIRKAMKRILDETEE